MSLKTTKPVLKKVQQPNIRSTEISTHPHEQSTPSGNVARNQ